MNQPVAPLSTDDESKARLMELVSTTLASAKRLGASAAEAAVSSNNGLSVSARIGEVETIEHTRDKGVAVTVYFGHRKGSASTSDIAPNAIEETVAAACNIARHTSDDPCAGLADAERMASHIPELDLHHPWHLEAPEAIDIALATEAAAREEPRITNSEGATVSRHSGLFVYGNSHGFLNGYASSRHSLSCAVIAGRGDAMQRDYWYSVSRQPEKLDTPQRVGTLAAERTVTRLDPRQVDTCTVPVVYSADVARGLFGHLVAAVRGASQYRKASFLLDTAGQQVMASTVQIHERPHLRGALASAAFDGEGVATRDRDLIANGVLEGYVLDSYSARKLGLETTGNAGGVHNLCIEPTAGDLASLLREMGRGILITELMGFGINAVTGDYSRGAAGFWVEDGEIAYPVHQFTVASNLKKMFLGMQALGNDIDERGNVRCGSVLIDSMTIAGN